MGKDDEVKILGFRRGLFSLIPEWALKLKGVEYVYIEQDVANKDPMLLQYNPVYKKVPVLLHNGKPLAESLVILEYIDEAWKQNPLLPEDPYERATARFWAKFTHDKLREATFSVFSKAGDDQEKSVKEARECLKFFEKVLTAGKFFGGDKIGFVDIAAGWIPYWGYMIEEIVGIKLLDEENMPLIDAWSHNFLEEEIIKERLPPRAEVLEMLKSYRELLLAASTYNFSSTPITSSPPLCHIFHL